MGESCLFWRCYMWQYFWATAPSWAAWAEHAHPSFCPVHVPLFVLGGKGDREHSTSTERMQTSQGNFCMKTNSKINTVSETYCFAPRTFELVVSQDFLGRSQPVNFSQWMSAGRARTATCTAVISSSACDQAPRGCAWLMHLRAHVQSMMSWRLCCLLLSIVYRLSKSNKSPSFQFHGTFHNQLDFNHRVFCELCIVQWLWK